MSVADDIRHCVDTIAVARRMLLQGQIRAAVEKLRDAERWAELALKGLHNTP